jgi:hypothetical protein
MPTIASRKGAEHAKEGKEEMGKGPRYSCDAVLDFASTICAAISFSVMICSFFAVFLCGLRAFARFLELRVPSSTNELRTRDAPVPWPGMSDIKRILQAMAGKHRQPGHGVRDSLW